MSIYKSLNTQPRVGGWFDRMMRQSYLMWFKHTAMRRWLDGFVVPITQSPDV